MRPKDTSHIIMIHPHLKSEPWISPNHERQDDADSNPDYAGLSRPSEPSRLQIYTEARQKGSWL